MAYTKYSLTPANNTAAPPDGAPEGMLPSAVNDTMRDMMAQIRDVGDGVRDGTYTMTAPKITGGTITGVTLTGNTLTNPVITGATLTTSAFNGTVGATTASTGAFTTLSTSSTTTLSGLTASTALALDASKNVVSVTNTGTGNNVLSASPTLTGTIAGASLSLSSLTSGRVTYAGASGLLSDSANLVWDNANTRLGVGTASPAVTLHASASVTNSGGIGTEILRVANTRANTGTSGASISFVTNEIESTNQYVRGQITGEYDGSSNVNGRLLFATANTSGTLAERMRITSAGNVGIGTSSPNAKLQITSSAFPVLKVADAIGGGALALGDEGTNNNYVGIWRGAANSTSGGGFLNVQGNGIAFMSSDNVFGSASERMRIDSIGQLLVGTSSNTTNGGIIFAPDYNGAGISNIIVGHKSTGGNGNQYMIFNYNGTGIGSIAQDSTTGVLYNVTSDQRLKTNIVNAPSGNIDGIKVRSFDWLLDGNHQEYGMVAQELIEVAPYAVHKPENPDEMMGVDYSKLVPMMIKEIQDLKAEVNQLKAKIGV